MLLVLAGPNYNTERAALAWIGYPSVNNAADFALAKDRPPCLPALVGHPP